MDNAATQHTLKTVLSDILKLLHPFLPFITEELWSRMNPDEAPLIISRYPKKAKAPYQDEAVQFGAAVIEPVEAIRNIRGESNVPPGKRIPIVFSGTKDKMLIEAKTARYVEHLSRVDKFVVFESGNEPDETKKSATSVKERQTIYVPMAGLIDVAAETARLSKEIARVENDIACIERKLANKLFVENAPKEIVLREREKIAEAREKLLKLSKALEKVKSM